MFERLYAKKNQSHVIPLQLPRAAMMQRVHWRKCFC